MHISVQYLSMIIEEETPLFSGALLFLFIYNQSAQKRICEEDKTHIKQWTNRIDEEASIFLYIHVIYKYSLSIIYNFILYVIIDYQYPEYYLIYPEIII